ncbi:hypothetical protein WDZ92_47715, partial [Nostoc sp. NIES-2111]
MFGSIRDLARKACQPPESGMGECRAHHHGNQERQGASVMLSRRSLSLLPFAIPAVASAQENWPARPIRMIIPFSAGGPPDVGGRVIFP